MPQMQTTHSSVESSSNFQLMTFINLLCFHFARNLSMVFSFFFLELDYRLSMQLQIIDTQMLRIHPYIIPFFHCQNAQRIVSFYKSLYIAYVYEFDSRPFPTFPRCTPNCHVWQSVSVIYKVRCFLSFLPFRHQ